MWRTAQSCCTVTLQHTAWTGYHCQAMHLLKQLTGMLQVSGMHCLGHVKAYDRCAWLGSPRPGHMQGMWPVCLVRLAPENLACRCSKAKYCRAARVPASNPKYHGWLLLIQSEMLTPRMTARLSWPELTCERLLRAGTW